jgi:hypothetical protein
MHDPKHKAVVQAPVAPLGVTNRKLTYTTQRYSYNKAKSSLPVLANPIIPGQATNPALDQTYAQPGLGQKALLAKRFAKAK